jgi:hypothetical protein
MSKVVNITNLRTVNFIKGQKGQFRFVVKVKAGFVTINESPPWQNEQFSENPSLVLGNYEKGALQTVEFKAEGSDFWLTVFARVGKKIKLVDLSILEGLKVGTINQLWLNTELYSQEQYKVVNAKSWDSKAYVMNEVVEMV